MVDFGGLLEFDLHGLLVLNVEQVAVLFGEVLDYFVEHHDVEFDFNFAGVGVVEFLAVLVALEVVEECLVEEGKLEAQLGQEEIVVVDSLVVDLDVLIDLDGLLRVLYGFLVVRQLPLANRQVHQRVHQARIDHVVLADLHADLEHLFCALEVLGFVEVVAVLEQRSRVFDDPVVVLHVLHVDLEIFFAIVVELLPFGDFDETQKGRTHLAHDLMLLVEADPVIFSHHSKLLLLLILIELHLLQDVDCVLLLLGLDEDPAGNDAVQQILEMLLGLASPREEIFLELLIILVVVLLVDFHGREDELSAVDERTLEFLVAQVIKGESSLLQPFLHQSLNANQISKEAVLA